MPVLNPEALIDERVSALKRAHADAGLAKAELDLSGGIDSAVMAGLLVLAVGPENLILVHSNINSNPEQTARAQALADAIGVPMNNVDLGDVYVDLLALMFNAIVDVNPSAMTAVEARIKADPTILGSIRSTLRAPIGRAFNRLLGGGIRHGTGNEDEDRVVRFYQKGGDGEVDSNPIAFLSKGEVYQLGLALGKRLGPAAEAAYLPIINATPSPDLWGTGDQHTDESELKKWLGVDYTYSRIDPVTGQYSYVGTNERVNRFLDTMVYEKLRLKYPIEELLFDPYEDMDSYDWVDVIARAVESGIFKGMTAESIEALLRAAQRAEKATRHKLNPNIPTYGDREDLVGQDILTNKLPVL